MEIKKPVSRQPLPEHAHQVFSGKIFDVFQWDQKMYDGTTQVFEKARRVDAAVVLPVLDDGTIILLEQEQPGKARYLSTCGGRIDPGEDPLTAVQRELREETGYEAKEYFLWRAINPSSKIDYTVYYFIAKGCAQVTESEFDGGEKITIKPVTFDEFIKIVREKRFMEKELVADIYEALLDKDKYSELQKLFSPNI